MVSGAIPPSPGFGESFSETRVSHSTGYTATRVSHSPGYTPGYNPGYTATRVDHVDHSPAYSPGFAATTLDHSPIRSVTNVAHHAHGRVLGTGPTPVARSPEREYISAPRGNAFEPVTTVYPPKEYCTRSFSPERHHRLSSYSPERQTHVTEAGPYGIISTGRYEPGYVSHRDVYEPPEEKVTRHYSPPRAVTTMPPRYVGTSSFVRTPDLPTEIAMGRTYYDGASTTFGDPGKLRIERNPGY